MNKQIARLIVSTMAVGMALGSVGSTIFGGVNFLLMMTAGVIVVELLSLVHTVIWGDETDGKK